MLFTCLAVVADLFNDPLTKESWFAYSFFSQFPLPPILRGDAGSVSMTRRDGQPAFTAGSGAFVTDTRFLTFVLLLGSRWRSLPLRACLFSSQPTPS
jgi:hypothetical protein